MTRSRCLQRQNGQALVLVVLLLGVLVAAVYMGYNVAQVASTKSRVMHASDNAAYSAANYQARIMNYMAYTNRAMITNHVTAAQQVTARGYIEYQAGMTSRICDWLCNVPYVGQFVRAVNEGVSMWRSGINVGAPIVVGLVNVMNFNLQLSQAAIWQMAEVRMPEVVRDVARANVPDAQVVDVPLWQTVWNYRNNWTRQYSTQGDLWRFGRTVVNARDSWTANRGHNGWGWLLAPMNLSIVTRNWHLAKRGGTELSSLRRWESTDDLSFKNEYLKCKWFNCSWRPSELRALGWGSATSGSGGTRRGGADYGNSKNTNNQATNNAWNNQQTLSVSYRGIENFVDLQDNQRNRNLPVVVEIFVDRNAVKTANQTNSRIVAGPNVRMNDQFVSGRIASISKAETRFVRPTPRIGGSTELASTFSPYWQATLVNPSTGDRGANDLLSGRGLTTQTPYY